MSVIRKPFKLDQLGTVGRGRSRHRPRNDPSLYGGDYPFFQTGDIKAAELYLHDYSQTYNDKGLAQSKLWQPGTVCVTIAANIAESAILSVPGCFPDSVVGFLAFADKSDGTFIKYYIDTIKLQMQSASRGTTQDNLSLDKLLTFDFVVPNVDNQRRIASILSAYDDLIENNIRRIAVLEELARCLYEEWFVRFRFPGHEQARMVESELGLIPDGWTPSNLSSVVEKSGRKYSDNLHSRLPLIDLARIPRRSNALVEVGDANEIKTSRIVFDRGEILFGAIRPYFHKVLLAPFGGVTNVSVHVFKAKLGVPSSFAYSLLFSDAVVAWATQHSGGMKMPVIGWDVFQKMPVAIPPTHLLADFDRVISPMLAMVTTLVRKNLPLRATRELLLPKLISGEIDVSTFPEPETVAA